MEGLCRLRLFRQTCWTFAFVRTETVKENAPSSGPSLFRQTPVFGTAVQKRSDHIRGRRHALVVVLSHSRLLWLCFYRRQTMAVLTDGLERAFARFGGVPKELLFDQMRAVVLSDQRVGGGELVLNAEFLRVAAHWGFPPARVPAVSGADEGQGGAANPLHP